MVKMTAQNYTTYRLHPVNHLLRIVIEMLMA
jgi:hypothetical protein